MRWALLETGGEDEDPEKICDLVRLKEAFSSLWLSQKCVHRGNEVLKGIYEVSHMLVKLSNLKHAPNKSVDQGYFLKEVLITLHFSSTVCFELY